MEQGVKVPPRRWGMEQGVKEQVMSHVGCQVALAWVLRVKGGDKGGGGAGGLAQTTLLVTPACLPWCLNSQASG